MLSINVLPCNNESDALFTVNASTSFGSAFTVYDLLSHFECNSLHHPLSVSLEIVAGETAFLSPLIGQANPTTSHC
jgi:hypothetical protein